MPTWGWRVFVALVSLPSFFVALLRVFVTEESPRYLWATGQTQEAIAVLERIWHTNDDARSDIPNEKDNSAGGCITSSSMMMLMLERRDSPLMIMDDVHPARRSSCWNNNLGLVFSRQDAHQRQHTLVLGWIWFFHFSGYWGISMYLPAYLKTRGGFGDDVYLIFLYMVLAEIPALALLVLVVDRLGRKTSLRLFLFGAALSTAVFAYVSSHSHDAHEDHDHSSRLVILSAMGIYFCTTPVFATLFTYTPESYPTEIRTTIMGLMNGLSSCAGIIVPLLSATLVEASPAWLYPCTWSACFLTAAIASCFLQMETTSRCL